MDLGQIETLTRTYAAERNVLIDRVRDLDDELAAIKRKRLPAIRRAVERVAEARQAVEEAINEDRALFARPRTRLFHGVKVGLQKAKGKLAWADPSQVIRLIRRHLADQAEVLIKVTEAPVRSALGQLPAGDLKRIGVTVEETGDEVVVRPTDSEIDKLVDALLEDGAAEGEAAA